MAKAVQSSSTTNCAALILLLALAGCARPAPDLPAAQDWAVPPAQDSPDRLARCTALAQEIVATRHEMTTIEDVLAGKRQEDQVTGYLFDVLFPPALLVMDQHSAQKKALDERQAKVDADLAEEHRLRCPSTT
jgi:hypothetical protein